MGHELARKIGARQDFFFFFEITFEIQTRLLKYLGFVDPGQRYKTFFCPFPEYRASATGEHAQ